MDPRPSVITSALDGTDRIYLDMLAPVSGLAYTHNWPGGPTKASWTLGTDAAFSHKALRPGRRVRISAAGFNLWTGKSVAPVRATPWTFEADGDAALTNNYRAVPSGANAYDVSDVFTQAISRGLPVTQNASEVTWPAWTSNPSADLPEMTVAEVANKVTGQGNSGWAVRDGRVRTYTPSYLNPTHLLRVADPADSRTLDGLVTALRVKYTSNTTHASAYLWVRNTVLEARYGVCVEDVLDLTDQQELNSNGATSRANSVLAIAAVRALFGGSFTVAHGQLTTLAGQPVCLASVQLPCVPLLMLTDPDRSGEQPGIGPTAFVTGEYTYHADTGTAELVASDSVRATLLSLLAGAPRTASNIYAAFAG